MTEQLPLSIQLGQKSSFEEFSWGRNQVLKQEILKHNAGIGEAFIYIWGPSGSGKSHLLQASCQSIHHNQSAIYLPLALLKNCGPQMLEDLNHQRWIFIDDLDEIVQSKEWEEALFHLFNRVRDEKSNHLMMTGKKSPAELGLSLADLQSRLNGTLIFQLQTLSDEDKIQSLSLHAQKRGLEFPPPVAQFLLNRADRNMNELLRLLELLDKASLINQRKITIPFVKMVLNI